MSLGDEWTESTPASASKLNGMTVTYGSGTYLDSLDKTKHKLVVCTSTSGTLTADHVYLADSVGTSWIDISRIANHTHTRTAGDGGAFANIIIADPFRFDLALTRTNDLQKAQWIQTVTGTGSISDDTDGTTGERSIKLLTGATSGSGSTISYPHLKGTFGVRAIYLTKVRFSATTSLAFHTGLRADDVTAADSNTKKFNAEVCTATNGNWFLRTADGSTTTSSDTGTPFGTNRTAIRIVHYPDLGTPETDLYINGGTVFQKTTNIPTGGSTADNNLIKHSLKNSAAEDKNVWMYGCRLNFEIDDDWG